MAARKQATDQDLPEADRLAGAPHPRDTAILFGQSAAEQDMLATYRSARMHHAWLIQGEEGIGKATLAYRFARFVLANPDPNAAPLVSADNLDVASDHPVSRRIAAQAHPDLHVLRRAYDPSRKTLASAISVDSVRKGLQFFAMTAGEGGWRIMIVDAADDMNVNAANALLKTLEEPPPRALLLLISHAPGKLLATIKSRCRRLTLPPLGGDDLFHAVEAAGAGASLAALNAEDRQALLDLSRGSVRRALMFLDGGEGLLLWREISALLAQAPRLSDTRLHALAAKLGRAGAQDDFSLAMELIGDWLSARLHAQVDAGAPRTSLARLAQVWEKTGRLAADTEIFHFDRKRVILNVFRSIAAAFD